MPELKEKKNKRLASDQPAALMGAGKKRTASTATGPLPSMSPHQGHESDWPFPTDYCDHFEVSRRPPGPSRQGSTCLPCKTGRGIVLA